MIFGSMSQDGMVLGLKVFGMRWILASIRLNCLESGCLVGPDGFVFRLNKSGIVKLPETVRSTSKTFATDCKIYHEIRASKARMGFN